MTDLKVLFLCTGNSCRSQMSEGFARAFHPTGTFYSAGTAPAEKVNPRTVTVMAEKKIDISSHKPEHLTRDITSTGAPLDYVSNAGASRQPQQHPTLE